jgi:hypothetical protein
MRKTSLILLSALGALGLSGCSGTRLEVGIDGSSGGFAGSGGRLAGGAGGYAGTATAQGGGGAIGPAGGTIGSAPGAGGVTSTGGSVGPGAGGAGAGPAGGAGAGGSAGAGGTSTPTGLRFLILPPVDPTGSIHTDREYNSVVNSASDDGSVLVGVSNLYEAATDLFRSYQFYWTADAGVVRLDDVSPTNHDLDGWVTASPDGTSLIGMLSEKAPVGYQYFNAPWQLDAVRADYLSADGTTLVATATVSSYSGGGMEQFRWRTSDGFVSLTALPRWPADGLYYSQPSGTPSTSFSDDGNVIAGYHQSASGVVSTPFIWKDPGTLVELGHLPGFPTCSPSVVSGDGTVVYGNCADAAATVTAFRWTAATGMVSLGAGYYPQTTRDGQVAMGSDGTGVLYRWTADAGVVRLQPSPDVVGTAHPGLDITAGSLSTDGGSVYGSLVDLDFTPGLDQERPREAFRWTASGGFVRLGFLDGNNLSTISAATRDGAVLAGVSRDTIGGTSYTPARPAVWDCQGVRSIVDEMTAAGVDLQGLQLSEPFGVWSNPSGIMVVGYGTTGPSSDTRTWVAWLPRRC